MRTRLQKCETGHPGGVVRRAGAGARGEADIAGPRSDPVPDEISCRGPHGCRDHRGQRGRGRPELPAWTPVKATARLVVGSPNNPAAPVPVTVGNGSGTGRPARVRARPRQAAYGDARPRAPGRRNAGRLLGRGGDRKPEQRRRRRLHQVGARRREAPWSRRPSWSGSARTRSMLTPAERDRFVTAMASYNNQGAGVFRDFRAMHRQDIASLDPGARTLRASWRGIARTCSTSSGSCRRSTRASPCRTGDSTCRRRTSSPRTSWAGQRPARRHRDLQRHEPARACGGPTTVRASPAARGSTSRRPGVRSSAARRDAAPGRHAAERVFDTGPDAGARTSTRWRATRTAVRTRASTGSIQTAGDGAARPVVLPAALQRRSLCGPRGSGSTTASTARRPRRTSSGAPARRTAQPPHRPQPRRHDVAVEQRSPVAPRPSNAPRTPFPVVPTAPAPGGAPTVGDMIDYQAHLQQSSYMNFAYDDVPFGVAP